MGTGTGSRKMIVLGIVYLPSQLLLSMNDQLMGLLMNVQRYMAYDLSLAIVVDKWYFIEAIAMIVGVISSGICRPIRRRSIS